MKRLVRDLGAVAILVVATAGFFWQILFTSDAWKPAGGGDLVSFLYPTYRFAAARLQLGDLPLWNPHLYGGAPFLADAQTGLFYPPNLILSALAPAFGYRAMEWLAVLHVLLAGLSAYFCLRFLEPGRPLRIPAALVGALAFMFSDLFAVHFGNLNLIAVVAWLPLILLLFWRAVRLRRLSWALGAGVVLGISTLAGHLQMTLYTGLALVVAAGVAVVEARRGEARRGWAWPLLALAVTAGVGMGLSALILLPAAEYARLSPRAALPYQQAARFSLIPGLLGEMLVPALFNSREPSVYWGVWDRVAVGYLGILPVLLAGLGLLLCRGRRVRLFAVLALVAFLLALGGQSVFHGWAYRFVPGFGQLRAPARLVVVADLALAALAALALDRLLRPLDRRARLALGHAWRWLVWLLGLAAVAGGLWAYLVVFYAQDRDPAVFWRVSQSASGVIVALLLFGASLAWLAARRSGRLRRPVLAALAIGLVYVDLASVQAYTDVGTNPPTTGYDHLQAVAFLHGEPGLFRIDSRTDVADAWQPDLALLAGLYDVGGVDNPLVVADVDRYWEGTGGRSTRLYDLLGVRYVIASKDVVLDWSKFELAFDGDPAMNVYRNTTALPRAFVVHDAVVAAGHEDAWQRIHDSAFDPAAAVVIEGSEPLAGLRAAGGPAEVRVLRYETDRVELEVDNPAPGYLVLSDPFYPGWQALVDGQPAPLERADYAFRAVPVPAGSHQVTFVFRPLTWHLGLAITIATLVVLAALGIWVVARNRRATRP